MNITSDLSNTSIEIWKRAAFEATNLHHSMQGPEHIVLAMLSKNDSPAYRVLSSVNVTYTKALPIVRAMHLSNVGGRLVEQYSASAKAVVNDAIKIARKNNATAVARPGHLLEALLRSNDINVAQLFDSLRINRKAVLRRTIDAVSAEEN